MLELFRELCCLDGTSGRENQIREYIIRRLEGREYKTDNAGNIIVNVKGEKRAKNKVMLCAHMDEVGIIASFITNEGYIKFSTVGGIKSSALLGKAVRFESGIRGVIGIKPVHLCSEKELLTLPQSEDLYIDIGAKNKEDAEKYVLPGDAAVFAGEFLQAGEKFITKAADDRAGCAVMLDMIRSKLEYDTVFVFNAMEEIGLRGAAVSAYSVAPDYALVLEATTAADVFGVPEEKQVCALGKGVAVSFMDLATVYDFSLYKKAFETAERYSIAVQPKCAVAGGNDAGSIHKSREGVKTLTLSIPCRYIHSPSCVCDKRDILALRQLAEKMSEYFANA